MFFNKMKKYYLIYYCYIVSRQLAFSCYTPLRHVPYGMPAGRAREAYTFFALFIR